VSTHEVFVCFESLPDVFLKVIVESRLMIFMLQADLRKLQLKWETRGIPIACRGDFCPEIGSPQLYCFSQDHGISCSLVYTEADFVE